MSTNLFNKLFYRIHIPPLFPITLSLIIGILTQSFELTFPIYAAITLTILVIFARTILVIFARHNSIYQHKLNTILIILLSFLTGSLLYIRQIHNHKQFFQSIHNKTSDCIGTVIDIKKTKNQKLFAIILKINRLRKIKEKIWVPSDKTIIIYTLKINNLEVADTINLPNITFKQSNNQSFNTYLIKEHIAATVFISNFNYKLIYRPSISFSRWIYHQKQRITHALKEKLSLHTFSFFSSLFLGNRTNGQDNNRIEDYFRQWGIMHFLARSGLHLAIFILIWKALLCCVPLPFIMKQAVLLSLSIIYFILTWPSTSFIRAFATFLLYKLCIFTKKPFHFLHALNLVCLSFLICNPMQLFFLDFQLTFTLTAALSWFNQLQHIIKTNS